MSGRCDSCTGHCCTRAAKSVIPVFAHDVARLSKFLQVSEAAFTAEYVVPPAEEDDRGDPWWPGNLGMRESPEAAGGACCPFLAIRDGVGRCSVYEARPKVCRAFEEKTCTIHVLRS